ncbi:MAG: hypothetical protein MRK01_00070 [Candidatus Scalindua sp.]|nr:hypothetical protein [Candidatus Scalindua sp.]
MDISRCFEKKHNLFRCTHCSYEYVLSLKEIIKTKRKQPFHKYDENISPFQEVCMMCCKGLMIPLKFTNGSGETVIFKQIKPKVSMPDDETILARIILFQNEEI